MIKPGDESTVAVNFWKKLHKVEPGSALVTKIISEPDSTCGLCYFVQIVDRGKFANLIILEPKGKARRIFLEQD